MMRRGFRCEGFDESLHIADYCYVEPFEFGYRCG
jgi:hypothetical protein